MIRACLLGMCNGDFVFIHTSLDSPGDNFWYRGDKYDDIARKAYKNVFHITSADWVNDVAKQRLDEFNVEVIDRMSEWPWYSTEARDQNIPANSRAHSLYEAMYLFGLWINHTLTTGTDLRDGAAFLEFSSGISFEGISGPCDIGPNGDKIPYFRMYQFLGDNSKTTAVALCQTKNKTILDIHGFEWQTADQLPPPDEPLCGFFDEFCVETTEDNSTVVIIAITSVFTLLILIAVVGYTFRKRQLENNLIQSIWRIQVDDIELQKSKIGIGSRLSVASKTRSLASLADSEASNRDVAAMTTVGQFKGQNVAIRNIKSQNIVLTRELMVQLKTMRELTHDNVNHFIGACFDAVAPMMIFLYCQKGSLQDILENDDIELDTLFKYSLTMDLVHGMNFIHSSKLECHGRLKSTNCLVDNRWVLRITDYGVTQFVDDSSLHHSNSEENQKYKSLLWTAPEILQQPVRYQKGTKAGDVYSYGIILHEIFYRMGTFAGKAHMTAKDIVGRVKNRENTPCRPEIFADVEEVTPFIVKLMKLCWEDIEENRPTFAVIKTYLKKNVQKTDTNIVDKIMERLQKYASNLEDLVDQRTQQLMLEKQKTDKLLYRMLPASCADKLKIGEPVFPEIFDSATVFFSDIVGFTTIAAKSKPMEVVDLLNDLYICFDAIIAKHDAYKVETIGDAYLVVSGIPTRNGSLHTSVIADMSLAILTAVSTFKITHLPKEVVRVRIGLHTGPCCAGVVGLSMPRYCLFGDTVNTASRMESNGSSQRIHVSEAVHLALNRMEGYYTSYRGEMPIKGKGIMKTYWLDGKEGYVVSLPNELEE